MYVDSSRYYEFSESVWKIRYEKQGRGITNPASCEICWLLNILLHNHCMKQYQQTKIDRYEKLKSSIVAYFVSFQAPPPYWPLQLTIGSLEQNIETIYQLARTWTNVPYHLRPMKWNILTGECINCILQNKTRVSTICRCIARTHFTSRLSTELAQIADY